MIVKYIGKKGGGSVKATFDYLLGKDRTRERASVLSGDPDLTQSLCESLDFKNKYTVGVLSFEERNIEHKDKLAIMKSFEDTTFAGLNKDDYNICWIEHTDKDRLELNFVIANVELSSRKRYQPYYDKVDRKLINNFQKVINHTYKLSDPDNPEKKRLTNSLSVRNLPSKTQELKNVIDEHVIQLIKNDVIHNQNDVIDVLKKAGFDISRVTDNSISLKNPDPSGKNIRLKGAIYEKDRRFSPELERDHKQDIERYEREREADYSRSLGELKKYTERKREFNNKTYKQSNKIHDTANISRINNRNMLNVDSVDNILHRQQNDRITRSDQELPKSKKQIEPSKSTLEQSNISRGRGRNNISNNKGKLRTLQNDRQQNSNQNKEIGTRDEQSLTIRCRKINNRVRSGESKSIEINRSLDDRERKRNTTSTKVDIYNQHIRDRKQEAKRTEQQANATVTKLEQRFNAFRSAIKRVREAIDQVTKTVKRSFGFGL